MELMDNSILVRMCPPPTSTFIFSSSDYQRHVHANVVLSNWTLYIFLILRNKLCICALT